MDFQSYSVLKEGSLKQAAKLWWHDMSIFHWSSGGWWGTPMDPRVDIKDPGFVRSRSRPGSPENMCVEWDFHYFCEIWISHFSARPGGGWVTIFWVPPKIQKTSDSNVSAIFQDSKKIRDQKYWKLKKLDGGGKKNVFFFALRLCETSFFKEKQKYLRAKW